VDVGKVKDFCDLGFRFTANGFEFNLEKLLTLNLKVDPKALIAIQSQVVAKIAAMTYVCRAMAAGWITPERFMEAITPNLQFAAELQAVRERGEELTGGAVTPLPDSRLDPRSLAERLGASIPVARRPIGDDPNQLIGDLGRRYMCECLPTAR
jgi:hypothetical protein